MTSIGGTEHVPRGGSDHAASDELDLVVLGGGGHVGLPLSLVFARAGFRVGIFDSNQATLDGIGRGRMPFMETGAEELLRELLPTGRLELTARPGRSIGRADTVVVVIGTPDGRVPQPVDDGLRARGRRRSRRTFVTARSSSCGARVYPGTTEYVSRRRLAARGLPRRRRVLPGAHRRGSRPRGARSAAPDRRRDDDRGR